MTIAILAVQGAFYEHGEILRKLGIEHFEIRQQSDLNKHFDGLIIPGGESTVQGKLIRELNLYDTLKEKILQNLPVFGTCAGLLLLAKQISNDEKTHLGTMNITAVRNAYGRQLGSFSTDGNFKGIGTVPMTFIRAPYIEQVGENVEILAEYNGKITAARENNQLVTAFHPELNDNLSIHRYFADIVENNA
ncbi:MAG: pyridoxal 5'-phosphate synthase glutaminase subunit PdxT [Ruminococcus sp.]|nr:pyridoxal 5'-phosphate synthase glutaminase subunit PdxT [Ruminococcus sp.]